MSILIKNAKIVNANRMSDELQDILIEDGKIKQIGTGLKSDGETIDAKGKLVMPGLIDIHVHFRTPGQEYKETIKTGCESAVKGGFTTVMCMPNTEPAIDNKMVVQHIIRESKDVGLCNVIPIGAVTRGRFDEELVDMYELKEAGCLALSDDGKSVISSRLMKLALQYSQGPNLLLIQHCEDPQISDGGAINEGEMSTKLGIKGDPHISETIIVGRDIELVNYYGGRVHFAHMSNRRSCELIRQAKKQNIPVTAEVCPHHFALTEQALEEFNTNAKVNPPLRTSDDVKAMKEAIVDGTIDCIVTDHAPHSKEDKEQDMMNAPFGMIGLETAVPLTIMHLVDDGLIDYPKMVELMSTKPAELVGLEGKGEIKEGLDADITILDPDETWVVTEEDIASKSKNTPFLGQEMKGRVKTTIYSGKVVYQD